jgi:putative transcriptional regulator
MADPYFSKTLTYICEHNDQGALGLVVNRPIDMTLQALFERLSLKLGDRGRKDAPVYFGGPVQTDRGFVLHSSECSFQATVALEGLSLTTSQDVLLAIAAGVGPKQSLITLGYAGWEAGQLEAELADNAWLNCPFDPDILFGMASEQRLGAAARSLGINLSLLTSQAGHA